MANLQHFGRNSAALIVTALLVVTWGIDRAAAQSTPAADETYLDALRGSWDMAGTL